MYKEIITINFNGHSSGCVYCTNASVVQNFLLYDGRIIGQFGTVSGKSHNQGSTVHLYLILASALHVPFEFSH